MVYDNGALRAALSVAVGEDAALVTELRRAFIDSAAGLSDLLGRSRCDANWQAAAWRLHGLSASFGAMDLMALAAEAADGAPGDPAIRSRIDHAIAAFDP